MPSNRFAFVIRYLNHAAPRMQEQRVYARVVPLRERILRPCIWPSWESHPSEDHSEAPSFVATARIVGVTSPDRFHPTAKSPLAPPLLLSPSSHLTQREVLPCFNAPVSRQQKESKECAVQFSCQRTLVLPKGQRTRGKGACLSRLYRNKNQISRGLSIKLFPKGLEFFLASLSDSLTLYSETPSIFAISFAVRFSA